MSSLHQNIFKSIQQVKIVFWLNTIIFFITTLLLEFSLRFVDFPDFNQMIGPFQYSLDGMMHLLENITRIDPKPFYFFGLYGLVILLLSSIGSIIVAVGGIKGLADLGHVNTPITWKSVFYQGVKLFNPIMTILSLIFFYLLIVIILDCIIILGSGWFLSKQISTPLFPTFVIVWIILWLGNFFLITALTFVTIFMSIYCIAAYIIKPEQANLLLKRVSKFLFTHPDTVFLITIIGFSANLAFGFFISVLFTIIDSIIHHQIITEINYLLQSMIAAAVLTYWLTACYEHLKTGDYYHEHE